MGIELPSAQETNKAILKQARRTVGVPVRGGFVQGGVRGRPTPGPLSILVRRRAERDLDLLLLTIAQASASPWDVRHPSQVWARALNLGTASPTAGMISKIWKRLGDMKLISRDRVGRRASVTLLREDGSGLPYDHPVQTSDLYFRIPLSYWTGDDLWCLNLNLPEKAMLLIALSLQDNFVLPLERVPNWYGISADTASRGINGLIDKGLLTYRQVQKQAPLTPEGITIERRYHILAPMRLERGTRVARRGRLQVESS
jgi:hypothetical protein